MQIICISRGTLSGGTNLAERLAEKLGYQCLSREDLISAAVSEGIRVGKLETAMMKPGLFTERLAIEREYYIAFTTAYLCEQARKGPLVYHGRTGHLLLPGLSHVLRVRVVADMEYRIQAAMQQLGVDRDKARQYVEEVDEDRRRWVHNLYGVSWEDALQYDIVVNLAQLSLENAAAALTMMAQLPDFQLTPASQKTMDNLRLAAHARLRLARDPRTAGASFKVRADNRVVTVLYNPSQSRLAEIIPVVLKGLEEAKEIRTTMATTNILWIQEEFNPQSETFQHITEIATKWNAAVELLRLTTETNGPRGPAEGGEQVERISAPAGAQAIGGIEEETAGPDPPENGGMKRTLDELAKLGRSGGGKTVHGGPARLVASLDRTIPYTLVVIGEVFLAKGHAARARLSRELRSFLKDRIRAPVVTAEEIKGQYLFSPRDALRLTAYLALTGIIYFLVFSHQLPILDFLSRDGWKDKLQAAGVVFLMVPVVAYLYGNATKTFLKLIKME